MKVDEAARRTEWWKRTQWAIELALSDHERRQEVGILALFELMDSPLADKDSDVPVVRGVMEALVPDIELDDEIDVNPPDDSSDPDDGGQ